jgi:hypothetical protein
VKLRYWHCWVSRTHTTEFGLATILYVKTSKKRLEYTDFRPYIRGDANGVASFTLDFSADLFGTWSGFAS